MKQANKRVALELANATKAKKPAGKNGRQPQPTGASDATGKLACRYCGSDDLAPSFIKRRDARCRACFKQRYGSAARTKGKSKSAA